MIAGLIARVIEREFSQVATFRFRWLGIVGLFSCLLMGGLALGQAPQGYAFKLAPLEIYDQFGKLELGEPPVIGKAERELLAGRWEAASKGENKDITDEQFLDALIFASGVEEPKEVDQLRQKYRQLLSSSKESLKAYKAAPERAEKLLTFLHQGVMKQGYDLEKTTFAEIFETNKYNCVSSTAIYCILGRSHGLKLQPISVPGSQFQAGHATVDLVENGKRIQIEPTNADGYDWDTKINQPGVISLNFGPARSSGHDVSYWHVPAMIYSNRGNGLKKEDGSGQLAMIRCYVGALALAPDDDGATNNMRAALVNWGPALIKAEKFSESVRAMEFAHTVAPEDSGVATNRRLAWERQIMHLLSAKKDAEAMQIAIDARNALGKEGRFAARSSWFEFLGQEVREKEGFEAALTVFDRAKAVLDADEMKAMSTWRISLARLWSQSLLEAKKYEESLAVLKRFYDAKAIDEDLAAGIGYHTVKALFLAKEKGDAAEVIQHYRALREAFADCNQVQSGAESFAYDVASTLWKEKHFDEASKLVDELSPMLESDKAKVDLGERLYDAWISELLASKKIDQAIERGMEGRKRFASSEYLARNLKDAFAARLEQLLADNKFDVAMEAAGQAAMAFVEDEKLKSRTAWLMIRADQLADSKAPNGKEQAASYLEAISKTLSEEERKELADPVGGFARQWSQNCLRAEDFSGSLSALKRMKPIAEKGAIDDGLAYHVQEALPAIYEKEGASGALAHIKMIREAFPMHEGAEEGIAYFLKRRIIKKADAEDFVGAMTAAKELAPAAKDDASREELKAYAYEVWVDGLRRAKKWEDGLAKAREAMKEFPKQSGIRERGAALVDAWAGESIDARKWDAAITIYERGLELFPGNSVLSNNLEYCKSKRGK